MLMKTQDIGYILQKLQSEKNVNDIFYITVDGVYDYCYCFPVNK